MTMVLFDGTSRRQFNSTARLALGMESILHCSSGLGCLNMVKNLDEEWGIPMQPCLYLEVRQSILCLTKALECVSLLYIPFEKQSTPKISKHKRCNKGCK